jgi:hypothetical protein
VCISDQQWRAGAIDGELDALHFGRVRFGAAAFLTNLALHSAHGLDHMTDFIGR